MTVVTKEVPLNRICINDEFNCRGKFAPIQVLDLVKSIEENGLIQPVIIAPYHGTEDYDYSLVAGFRRAYAHKVLKKTHILSVIREELDTVTALSINLTENLQRQNLTIVQEAKALRKLYDAGLSEDETARKVNMSRGWVQARFMLLSMPESIQDMASAGLVNQTQIRELYKIKDIDQQIEAAKGIKLARERGEKKPKVKVKIKNLKTKKERKKAEILDLLDFLMDAGGSCLGTRSLAWCAGEITTEELLEDFKEHYNKDGVMLNVNKYILLSGGVPSFGEQKQISETQVARAQRDLSKGAATIVKG